MDAFSVFEECFSIVRIIALVKTPIQQVFLLMA